MSEADCELLELTRSQSLILAGQQLQPQDPLYNMVFAFRIAGPVDVPAFQAAFQALVARCDALRTTFVDTQSGFRQRQAADSTYEPAFLDLSAYADPEERLTQWIETHSTRFFSLRESPFESVLLKLGETQYLWYLNQHHLLTDAWSVSVIFGQLEKLYRSVQSGGAADLPMLPAFSDYVMQEKSSVASAAVDGARAYWRERAWIPGQPSRFYRDAPQPRQGRTRRYPRALGAERTKRITDLIATRGFESFTADLGYMQVFATVLFAYLHRITGNTSLSIGTPSHSRSTPELRETVGLLISIFPLQLQLEQGETFQGLYARVARANQELLMHSLPEAAGVNESRAFDVLLNYIPTAFGEFDGMPVHTQWVHSGYGDSNHLLRLQVHNFDDSDEFTLLFDLNEDVFVGEEADWVIKQYLRLLDAMLADAQQEITRPALLGDGSLPPIMAGSDAWQEGDSVQASVVDRFIAQVVQSAAEPALHCQGVECSYAELDRRSSKLGHYLASRGVTSSSVVAVAMNRSIELVIAALGILRCGATLLPLDPAYPRERTRFMLRDAAASMLLMLDGGDTKEAAENIEILRLDTDWPLIDACRTGLEMDGPRLSDRAYIIYTSGSTGQPKGVVVGHRSLSNYIGWASGYYLEGEALDFPLFSPVCFDLTITSLLVPLVSGGTLVIYPESPDAAEITVRTVVEDNAIDIIKLTPAHLSLIQSMDLSRSRLRKLIVGGEDFKSDLARTITEYLGGDVQIYNEYGPTEATVACSVHLFDPARDTQSSVPIGRPITNARMYVLDEHRHPVPRGVTGEIYIGGKCIAEGYLNQPRLTAGSFLDDPFSPGEFMYRSGDRGRWTERGNLEYLGRTDHQVKIRGVRIETSEIEAALLRLPPIAEAVVEAVEQHGVNDAKEPAVRCHRCGLEGSHPTARIDESGVCRACRVYERHQDQAQAYFLPLVELQGLIGQIKTASTGEQDSIMLLSGGKDSSYALCRLVDLGLNPLVFTLDNGYISEGALANVRRLVEKLGLELVVGKTPAMDAIFVDSLTRHSNVCNGCFKTIYTLSMNIARERGIRTICTGLSRGQIFETRVAHLFQQGIYDADKIDRSIIEARKAYHRVDDVIARSLDVGIFEDDSIFEQIRFLDFYRYADVTLDEIYDYLHSRAPWIRPSDTGRSTNCLINDAGIYVHKRERGYHNYSLPYSWDVRLGHKDRDAAINELDDALDMAKVDRILADVGYRPREPVAFAAREDYLIAYYVAPHELPRSELSSFLARTLPAEFIPRQFVRLESLPLTGNGKIDRQALPRPQLTRKELAVDYVAPVGEMESALVDLWQLMLGLDEVGVEDNFFELGGDSIINVQVVAGARDQGIVITPQQIFDYPTIRQLAEVAGSVVHETVEQGPVVGEASLLPAQRRYLAHAPPGISAFNQSVLLECAVAMDHQVLELALQSLVRHHDALRSYFEKSGAGWRQHILEPEKVVPMVSLRDLSGFPPDRRRAKIEEEQQAVFAGLDVQGGRVIEAAYFNTGDSPPGYLLIAVNHLVVDGVSWWVLLSDLEALYEQLAARMPTRLSDKTVSVIDWAAGLDAHAHSSGAADRALFWLRQPARDAGISCDYPNIGANTLESAATIVHELDAETTSKLIREVPSGYGLQVPDILVTALLRTLLPWSGKRALQLDIEGHGREDPLRRQDPLRTVGWFTSIYPVTLSLGAGEAPGDELKAVKEQLRAVPFGGVEYGVYRYMSTAPAISGRLAEQPDAQVLFNYLGQWDRSLASDSRFAFARPIQVFHGSSGPRSHWLELNALVYDGRLQVEWSFSENLHRVETIQGLAQQYLQALHILIDYCLTTGESGLTPSDFPAADLSQQELDDVLEEFGDPD